MYSNSFLFQILLDKGIAVSIVPHLVCKTYGFQLLEIYLLMLPRLCNEQQSGKRKQWPSRS